MTHERALHCHCWAKWAHPTQQPTPGALEQRHAVVDAVASAGDVSASMQGKGDEVVDWCGGRNSCCTGSSTGFLYLVTVGRCIRRVTIQFKYMFFNMWPVSPLRAPCVGAQRCFYPERTEDPRAGALQHETRTMTRPYILLMPTATGRAATPPHRAGLP